MLKTTCEPAIIQLTKQSRRQEDEYQCGFSGRQSETDALRTLSITDQPNLPQI